MNTGVTQDPRMAQMLMAMNQQGVQQMGPQSMDGSPSPVLQSFARGGMVQGGGGSCPVCGYQHGGYVPGFAFGGFAGLGGAWGGNQRPGASSFPGMGMRPGPMPGQQAPAPNPGGGAVPGAPNGSWAGQYQYNDQGGVQNVNPNDPYGTYSNNRDPRMIGQGMRDLGNAGHAGVFDPRGNQALINSMQEGAQGTADALVRRNMTAADLSGMDPAQRAVAKLQALRDTGRGVQDIMAQTRANAAGSADQFYKSLYGQQLGGDLGFIGQTNDARLQDWMQGNQNARQNQVGLGGIIGGALGTGLGAYAGALGGNLGGKKP